MNIPLRIAGLLALVWCAGCGPAEEPADDLTGRYGQTETTNVVEAIEYTDIPYDFSGSTQIQSLYDFIPSENVWYGRARGNKYPFDGPCNDFGNEVEVVEELPAEIEGIVTLHPRYFQKVTFCSSEERYYASYMIEDESGGFLVLKDSRVADFTFGDRVKLKALTVMKFFDTFAIVNFVDEELVSQKNPIYFEDIGSRELTSDDIGRNVRIRREIADPPTNYNFNEMCLVPVGEDYTACDPLCVANEQCLGSVLVSVDRELGQRNPRPLTRGQIVEVTGPVVNSFGLRLLVSRLGQISFVEE